MSSAFRIILSLVHINIFNRFWSFAREDPKWFHSVFLLSSDIFAPQRIRAFTYFLHSINLLIMPELMLSNSFKDSFPSLVLRCHHYLSPVINMWDFTPHLSNKEHFDLWWCWAMFFKPKCWWQKCWRWKRGLPTPRKSQCQDSISMTSFMWSPLLIIYFLNKANTYKSRARHE